MITHINFKKGEMQVDLLKKLKQLIKRKGPGGGPGHSAASLSYAMGFNSAVICNWIKAKKIPAGQVEKVKKFIRRYCL
jgi:hypothetical protein